MRPLLIENRLVDPVSARAEAEALRAKLYSNADDTVRRAEEFMSIVKTMNREGNDPRLEELDGTARVLQELCDYQKLIGAPIIGVFNANLQSDRSGVKLFFEV